MVTAAPAFIYGGHPSRSMCPVMRNAIAIVAGALIAACARSNPPASPPAPAQTPVVRSDVFVRAPAAVRVTSLAAFQPDLRAVDGSFECGQREVMNPNTTSISAAFPTWAEVKATVVVFI